MPQLKPKCKACGDTGVDSKGGPCHPCLAKGRYVYGKDGGLKLVDKAGSAPVARRTPKAPKDWVEYARNTMEEPTPPPSVDVIVPEEKAVEL